MAVKYLSVETFEKAVAEFYGGDTGKVHTVLVLASKASAGTEGGIYLPKKAYYGKRKRDHASTFEIFRDSLRDIEEEGIVSFLCDRFPMHRIKVAKTIPGFAEKLVLTPGDDARVTSELEKRLRNAVGKDDFRLAREQLLRMIPELPPDPSGQMIMAAMDLIILNHQMHQFDILINARLQGTKDQDGKEKKDTSGAADLIDQKKVMQIRKDALMKRLGLDYDDINKRGGPTTGNLASAAEALKQQIEDRIATADLKTEAAGIHQREAKHEADPTREIDEIDLAYIKETAPTGEATGGEPINDDHA